MFLNGEYIAVYKFHFEVLKITKSIVLKRENAVKQV